MFSTQTIHNNITMSISCPDSFYHINFLSILVMVMFHLTFNTQIVNWRTTLKFPEEAKLSPEAKDLICRLLCNVEQRLGIKGADEIKVLCCVFSSY